MAPDRYRSGDFRFIQSIDGELALILADGWLASVQGVPVFAPGTRKAVRVPEFDQGAAHRIAAGVEHMPVEVGDNAIACGETVVEINQIVLVQRDGAGERIIGALCR